MFQKKKNRHSKALHKMRRCKHFIDCPLINKKKSRRNPREELKIDQWKKRKKMFYAAKSNGRKVII